MKRYAFVWWQVVLLFFAFTVSCVIAFFLTDRIYKLKKKININKYKNYRFYSKDDINETMKRCRMPGDKSFKEDAEYYCVVESTEKAYTLLTKTIDGKRAAYEEQQIIHT